MFGNVNSLRELNKLWSDHIDSLRMAGVDFNEADLLEQWHQAQMDFIEGF